MKQLVVMEQNGYSSARRAGIIKQRAAWKDNSVKSLAHKCENVHLIPQNSHEKLSWVVRAYHLSNGEMEIGGSLQVASFAA